MVPRYTTLCGVFAFLFLAGAARSQSDPDVFGTDDEGITIVGFQDFFPSASSLSYQGLQGERSGAHYAGLNTIPNGALITQVVFYVRDDEFFDDFHGSLCWSFVPSADGEGLDVECTFIGTTSGLPGETMVFTNFNPPVPVLYRQDVDGDGFLDVVNYYLSIGAADADITIRMARIRWKRQVSPAPAVATFNDVPTNHQFFQFVEALAASGITAGCGTDIYCPDAPLTRGQMAVFLAKALGLHWPWNVR